MECEMLIERLREQLIEATSKDNKDSRTYDKAADTLKTLLSLNMNNHLLNTTVATVIGLYQDDFWYGAKVFVQLDKVSMRYLHMYSYLIENIPEQTICYLASGPNVRNDKIFSLMLKEPRSWLVLMTNRYLPSNKRKRLLRKVSLYVDEEPLTEYKAVLYQVLQGNVFGKNLDLLTLPVETNY